MLPLALPAPTFRRADGRLDQAVNARYAEHVAGTWVTSSGNVGFYLSPGVAVALSWLLLDELSPGVPDLA